MTTMYSVKITCSVCGEESEFFRLTSTNEFAESDLDTRPPERMRSTIGTCVQHCPQCGYCYSDISKENTLASEIIKKSEYIEQLNNPEYPELANSFLCRSIIDIAMNDLSNAVWANTHAAWVCDDANMPEKASVCRKNATDNILKISNGFKDILRLTPKIIMILIDLLRRSGQFDVCVLLLDKCLEEFKEGDMRKVLEYQMKLLEKKDTSCHKFDEIS